MALIANTGHKYCLPRLTDLCNYAIRSTKSTHSLKTLCKLSIIYHKLGTECVNTQNPGKNDDHSYDSCVSLGQNSISINQERDENIILVDSLDQMLVDTTQQMNSSDTDIVIDSMNADIPLGTEDTYGNTNRLNPDNLHGVALPSIDGNTPSVIERSSDSTYSLDHDDPQGMVIPDTPTPNIKSTTPTKTEASNLVNSSLDSSFDEADKLSYDPTGTQLILPLKK